MIGVADLLEEPVLFDVRLPDLTMEHGGAVSPLVVRGWMWSADGQDFLRQRNLVPVDGHPGQVIRRSASAQPASVIKAGDDRPTILAIHALTGDPHVGGEQGWWAPLIGPGRVFDPHRYRILCFNNLGSCYGTSGPADDGFPSGPVTTWDQARTLLRALDALGIEKVALATGGSLGGMVTLALAALAPDRVERIAPIAACAAASAWIIGFNHVQRVAIGLTSGRGEGLALARQIAMLTYRAEPGLDVRQGRQLADGPSTYRMQTYLDYQGRKLVGRFETGTYLAMMDAMDHHDLARRPRQRDSGESWAWLDNTPGLDRIRSSCIAVGIDTDQLFFPVHASSIANALTSQGVVAEAATLQSLHGHDAFLIEWDQLERILERALKIPAGSDR